MGSLNNIAVEICLYFMFSKTYYMFHSYWYITENMREFEQQFDTYMLRNKLELFFHKTIGCTRYCLEGLRKRDGKILFFKSKPNKNPYNNQREFKSRFIGQSLLVSEQNQYHSTIWISISFLNDDRKCIVYRIID